MPAQFYIVQTFRRQGRKLVADEPRKLRSEEQAVETAKQLAGRKVGVVAYSIVVDSESDVEGEPKFLFKAGTLPADLSDE